MAMIKRKRVWTSQIVDLNIGDFGQCAGKKSQIIPTGPKVCFCEYSFQQCSYVNVAKNLMLEVGKSLLKVQKIFADISELNQIS